MTEAEWGASDRPLQLLDYVSARLSVRKQRLVGVGVSRTIPPDILGPDGARWLETADQLAEKADVRLPPTAVRRWWLAFWRGREVRLLHPNLTAVFFQVGGGHPRSTLVNVGTVRGATGRDYEVVDQTLADIVRDISGNPFRPAAVDPSWLTSTAIALAEGIYQERAFDRMPVLADALQDAGCDNTDILDHCRGDGPHVRGCWVVDLLTGRK